MTHSLGDDANVNCTISSNAVASGGGTDFLFLIIIFLLFYSIQLAENSTTTTDDEELVQIIGKRTSSSMVQSLGSVKNVTLLTRTRTKRVRHGNKIRREAQLGVVQFTIWSSSSWQKNCELRKFKLDGKPYRIGSNWYATLRWRWRPHIVTYTPQSWLLNFGTRLNFKTVVLAQPEPWWFGHATSILLKRPIQCNVFQFIRTRDLDINYWKGLGLYTMQCISIHSDTRPRY